LAYHRAGTISKTEARKALNLPKRALGNSNFDNRSVGGGYQKCDPQSCFDMPSNAAPPWKFKSIPRFA
jgi:hypothetical protein